MDYVKIEVSITQIDFDYTNLFKKRKHESFFGTECFYAAFPTYISIVEMDTTKIEDETNKLTEQLKNRTVKDLQYRFKDFELKGVDFNVYTIRASEQTAEWCIKNLTVPQLVNMGISIVNGED